ncbi:MAG: bifunctional isocitrate dehydrogenase kinase/phosphatase [Cyclobacteriaceae bacterium]
MTEQIVKLLINECARYFDAFQSFSKIAKYQFEHQLWHDQRKANIRRLDLIDDHLEYCRSVLQEWLSDQNSPEIWNKAVDLLDDAKHQLPKPILESFAQAAGRSLYPILEFITNGKRILFNPEKESEEILHFDSGEITSMCRSILLSPRLNCRFRDLDKDAGDLALKLEKLPGKISSIDVFPNLFFRNRHAYLIGLIHSSNGNIPLGVAFVNDDRGVSADAFFFNEADIIRIFEFTRSYILTDSKDPEGLLAFLHRVMPNKNIEQLIVNLGYREWGKSLMLNDFSNYISHNHLTLDHAPGIRGMVMMVFTSEDYPMVFKLIKDKIAYPKETTPGKVLDKYKLVARQDRVGRLADTQLFRYWKFPKDAFAPALLDEIIDAAGSSAEIAGDQVILQRLFTERKMIPLNLYLTNASKQDVSEVIIDYGRAIKDLAMSNIFPGDLLPKNFGVTQDMRVVFYDYDEVVLLTECNFKKLPPPRNEDELWDAESWTVARDNDIFPEELEKFIVPPAYRDLFKQHHGDLFDIEFWNHWKEFHKMEGFIDLQPY